MMLKHFSLVKPHSYLLSQSELERAPLIMDMMSQQLARMFQVYMYKIRQLALLTSDQYAVWVVRLHYLN